MGAWGAVLAANSVFLSPFHQVSTMHDPGLRVLEVKWAGSESRPLLYRSRTTPLTVFNVTLSATRVPVPFVWAETQLPGRWSDNGMLMTSLTTQLQFYTDDTSITANHLAATLCIRSLVDVASGYNSSTDA